MGWGRGKTHRGPLATSGSEWLFCGICRTSFHSASCSSWSLPELCSAEDTSLPYFLKYTSWKTVRCDGILQRLWGIAGWGVGSDGRDRQQRWRENQWSLFLPQRVSPQLVPLGPGSLDHSRFLPQVPAGSSKIPVPSVGRTVQLFFVSTLPTWTLSWGHTVHRLKLPLMFLLLKRTNLSPREIMPSS